jgi:hypothetical protein
MDIGSHDFDFIFGAWRVRHRRLKERLAGCSEWAEFDGVCRAQPLLGGAANVDDNELDFPGGSYRAASLRSYDAAKQQWSIWWLDGRNPTQLDKPVVGKFENHIGLFFADDILDGQAIKVRFTWTATPGENPRWEQAFSNDGGRTWETNWKMEFFRIAS